MFSCDVVDLLCRELRLHFNGNRLRRLLLRSFQPASGPLSECLAAQPVAQAIYVACLPQARQLMNLVVAVHQRDEEPRMDALVRAVITKFGGVVAVDGSSAPLTEVRVRQFGACMKALHEGDRFVRRTVAAQYLCGT